MEKRLLLKDSKGELIAELLSFTYNAKRMGGAPAISATLHSFDELTLTTDDYVEFNGEKYYIKHTPTSSKSNTDERYKYDLEFVSERIMLDDIYFYDTTHSTDAVSKSIAKSADFLFSGTIYDLAYKINSSLEVSKIGGYVIVIGEDIKFSEYKQIKFSNTFISNAIQEFYNTFEVPYYFEWDDTLNKTLVHVTSGIAKSPNVAFEYGKDNALLSITKTNANYKIVNRATGVGSSENIPYYYPNESASGKHTLDASSELGEVTVNYDVLSKHANVADGETLVYHLKKTDIELPTNISYERQNGYSQYKNNATSFVDTVKGKVSSGVWSMNGSVRVTFNELQGLEYTLYLGYAFSVVGSDTSTSIIKVQPTVDLSWGEATLLSDHEVHLKFNGNAPGFNTHYLWIDFDIEIDTEPSFKSLPLNLSFSFYRRAEGEEGDYFELSDGSKLLVAKSGIKVETPFEGGVISISKMLNWIEPQKTLMPSIYRGTLGQERFYNAINGEVEVPFTDSDNANNDPDVYKYSFPDGTFVNPFNKGRPKEHIVAIDDIKPSIAGMEVNGERIDMFSAFAYDENDNDELDEENHYKHPYFYAKLKKLGFNLFEHANENGEMTISFTSGDCSACNFIIGVDEDTQKNTVQVDANGDLLRDEYGDVRSGREGKPKEKAQERQQDTINNEVWIALKKEDSTFGTLFPNATEKPSTEDTFVITNINLPLEYILAAEKRLEERIKQYLIDNNNDKFNFSIKFSRIYLAENKDVREQITENSSLKVIYQGRETTLYVSSYTYKMTSREALPEILVELSDTLSVSNGVMRNVINQVKAEVMTSVANVDIVAQGARAFVRKDQNDQTVYRLTANEMDVVKDSNIGGSLDVGDSASIGGELTVGRKAEFSDDVNVGGDINVGEYTEILGEISGAKIRQDGSAIFKSVRANALEVFTIIYNKIRATSAYTAFDDSGTITDISVDESVVYTITFDDSEFGTNDNNELGVQPFFLDDILHGYVNNLNMFEYSKAGECWMRVTSIPSSDNSLAKNQIRAILYSDEQVPTAPNLPPTTQMTLMHRGNETNTARQSTFYISSKDGNIIQLLGVDSPKLYVLMSEGNPENYSNYGVVIGKLPNDLFKYVQNNFSFIKEEDPILYAKYLAVQNLLQIDYAGRPIKTERYRGKWSIDEAVSNPYQSTDTSYDTVTHNGSLWQCQLTGTTVEPADNTAEWLKMVSKGDESTASIYELKPSPNIVYYRTEEEKLSVGRIDVVVGETNARGYFDITEQSVLNERNLAVYYSIDGTGERIFLNISPSALFELEDGSAVLATEDGHGLSLEGDDIDINAIEDNITIYLTDTLTNEDRATYVIPVVKDGSKGEDGLSPQDNLLLNSGFDKPIVYDSTRPLRVWNPWNTEVAWSIEENKFQNTNAISVSHSSSGIVYDGTFDVSGTYVFSAWLYQSAEQEAKISVNISNSCDSTYEVLKGDVAYRESTEYRIHDITTTSVGTFVQVAIRFVVYSTGSFRIILRGSTIDENYFCQPKMELSSHATPYRKAESDLTGPAGEAGISMYPLGDWMENVEYTRTDKSAPFVYYDADTSDNTEGTYYMLKAMRSENEKPSERTDVWEPITGQRAIYAKFLMADFALFGSDKGAVFYDRYLFSQHGLNNTYFGDAGDDIFDEDGNFKEFIPKLHLDFYSGLGSMSCLCEPFTTPPTVNGKVIINSVGGFNIKIPSLTADGNFPDIYNGYYPLLVLPTLENMEWAKNGSHITILFESGGERYGTLLEDSNAVSRRRNAQSIFLLVCVEDPANGIETPDYLWTGSYIFHKGRRSKHIILSQGNSVKLRASTVAYSVGEEHREVLYWYVENEGSIKEEKVDIYSMTSGDVEHAKTLTSDNCNRIQFYGADYSDEVNLKTDYHGEKTTTRGLMLYAGPEGFCPKNILYNPNGTTLYRRLHLDGNDAVDNSLINDYGPILR